MAELDRLAIALADRYRIERELGAGGMATVYLAEDLKHRRKVAVKVLRPDLAATLGPERFLREIEIAAGLHHPHILPLYDSGDADGFLYYVMPFEQGQSLRGRLARGGELPIAEAVRVLRDVADALAHAHEHGVVHRDIKPENILLSGQHAMVTDFGVAKAVSEATGRHALTTAGVALGTPAYMAPEQATADPNVDTRADIYAVGVVAYELLTGRTPFIGTTAQQMLAAHLTDKPDPVSRYRDTVPPALEAVVMRCLEKKPADRWQGAAELLRQLEALTTTPSGGVTPTGLAPAAPRMPRRRYAVIGGLAAAVVVGGLGVTWFQKVGRAGTLIGQDVLAEHDFVLVAEFENRTADATLAATVTDAIRVELQQSRVVQIMGQQAMWAGMRRMGLEPGAELPDSQVQELAERESAKAFVIGDIGRLGGGYQLTARVIATTSGTEALTVRATARDDAQLIEAVEHLGRELRSSIGESLRSVRAASSLARVTTASLPALRAFMAGTRAENDGDRPRAITHLREAVGLDTAFAMAWRALGAIYGNNDRYRLAADALERAYRFRDRLPESERLQVSALYHSDRGEWPLAEAAYLQMLELDPTSHIAWAGYSNMLLEAWRWPEAERAALRGTQANPAAAVPYWNAVEAQVVQGRIEAADSTLGTMIRHLAGNPWIAGIRTRIAFARREFSALQKDLEADGDFNLVLRGRNLCLLNLYRGRLDAWTRCRSGDRELETDPYFALTEVRLGGDTARARSLATGIAREISDSTDPGSLAAAVAVLAEVGRLSEARRLFDDWARRVGQRDRGLVVNASYARGAIAAAEGKWDSAATAFLAWNRSGYVGASHVYNRGLVEAASALDRAGHADSALPLFERALALPSTAGGHGYEVAWYPFVLRRLGELHESRGQRDQAVDYYARFIELWKDADPALQPQVRAVRDRLARLGGEPAGR